MSFDVISLFTKVPTALALEVVQQRLTSDETLQERTSLTVDDIIGLLSLCLDDLFCFPKCHLSADIWHYYGVSGVCGGHQSGNGACGNVGSILLYKKNPFLEMVC